MKGKHLIVIPITLFSIYAIAQKNVENDEVLIKNMLLKFYKEYITEVASNNSLREVNKNLDSLKKNTVRIISLKKYLI